MRRGQTGEQAQQGALPACAGLAIDGLLIIAHGVHLDADGVTDLVGFEPLLHISATRHSAGLRLNILCHRRCSPWPCSSGVVKNRRAAARASSGAPDDS